LLVPAATPPDGDLAKIVPPAAALLARGERFLRRVLRNVLARHHGGESPRRSYGLIFLDGHRLDLRVLGHFRAGLEPHISLFPIRTVARETSAAAQLARNHRR